MRTNHYYALASKRETPAEITSEEIAKQIAEFEARGGTIQRIPVGVSGVDIHVPMRVNRTLTGKTAERPFLCKRCGDTNIENKQEGQRLCRDCARAVWVERYGAGTGYQQRVRSKA